MDKETFLKNMNENFSWKRLLILILLVVFPAILVCVSIYWSLNEIIKTQDEHINILNNQINATSEKINNLSK